MSNSERIGKTFKLQIENVNEANILTESSEDFETIVLLLKRKFTDIVIMGEDLRKLSAEDRAKLIKYLQ